MSDRIYSLQRIPNIGKPTGFSTLQGGIPGQTGTTSFTDTNPLETGLFFYRVEVQRVSFPRWRGERIRAMYS